MLTDARSVPDGTRLTGDVCIIGAGAAGITVARELSGRGLRVLLLESGGFEAALETQRLYAGENVGHPYFPLESCRLRFFGGTTNHWVGYCRPLDAVDFETRDWIPGSGWPISRVELDPYYERARPILELGSDRYDAGFWEEKSHLRALPFEPGAFVSGVFQISPPTRLGVSHRDELVNASDVSLVLHANAIALETAPGGHEVQAVRVATLAGRQLRVEASLFVLATGGIENARLLLASSSKDRPTGLGNEHDLVGRYFMEHPHLVAAFFVPLGPGAGESFYAVNETTLGRFIGILTLREEVLRRESLNPLSITFLPTRRTDDRYLRAETSPGVVSLKHVARTLRRGKVPEDLGTHVWNVASDLDDVALATYRRAIGAATEGWMYEVFFRTQQTPNPESRVTLADEVDALGMPRARLDWRLSDQDLLTIERGHELLGQELGRAGLGRLFFPGAESGRAWVRDVFGGNHHMGTTRMHPDSRRGVVDVSCRVHSARNLYVAGSSVFPTSGYANPTLTIVALSLRLADHIKRILR